MLKFCRYTNAISNPPPKAGPFIAATNGFLPAMLDPNHNSASSELS